MLRKLSYANLLPKRSKSAHKGECGRVAIIGGSKTMIGAAMLASRAVLRSQAGLSYLLTIDAAIPYVNIASPEIIALPVHAPEGFLDQSQLDLIRNYLKDYKINSVGIGPGLGRNPATIGLVQALVTEIVEKLELPVVIDADALFAVSVDMLGGLPAHSVIITPHFGEFKRIFEGLIPKTTDDRVELVKKAWTTCRQVILLKGQETLLYQEGDYVINESGNEGMATAGSGDVLTGVIASFLAQGLSKFEATGLAAFVHGLAGDLALRDKGYGLIASDIIESLPAALMQVKKNA